MTDYDNTDRGALFKNDRKESDKHPYYTGTLNVSGVDYWLSGWINESKKDGRRYISLAVKPKESSAQKPTAPAPSEPDLNDDIPF